MRLARTLSIFILCVSAWLFYRTMRGLSMTDMYAALQAQNASSLWLAGLFTAISFAVLALYDLFALRIVAPECPAAGLALFAGATANACSNTLGVPVVTATAIRLRVYRRAGLGVRDVARITALSGAALIFGFLTMLALVLIAEAGMGSGIAASIGMTLALFLGGLLVWLSQRPRRIAFGKLFGGWRLDLPSAQLALLQMMFGAVETAAAIGALYVLLPAGSVPIFPVFAVGYLGAVVLGIGSHSPGGIGVFEAAMMALLVGPGHTVADGAETVPWSGAVLAALLTYRLIYNILPFAISAISLAVLEITRTSSMVDRGE